MQKIVNGVVTDYVLHGKNIVHMKRGSDELHFFYDAQNRPAVVVYNNVPYAYVKNLQGDVIAILDAAGNVVVSYAYDAWGQPIGKNGSLVGTLGTVQPFRYRGYVFDEETGLYYLRSRYYNSASCRFVSEDVILLSSKAGTHNLYCYCVNSPTVNKDENGNEGSPVTVQDQENFEAFIEAYYRSTGRKFHFPAGDWTYTCTHEKDASYENQSWISSEASNVLTWIGLPFSVAGLIALCASTAPWAVPVGAVSTIGGSGLSVVGCFGIVTNDEMPTFDEYQHFTIAITGEEIYGYNEYSWEEFGKPMYRPASHLYEYLYIEIADRSGVMYNLEGRQLVK